MRGDGTIYLRRWQRRDGAKLVRPWLSYWQNGRKFQEAAAWAVDDGDDKALKAAVHEARKQLRRRLAEIQTGLFTAPAQERMTVAEIVDAYLADRRLEKKGSGGLRNIEQRCAHLKRSLGAFRAIGVTLPMLTKWAGDQEGELAPGTVKIGLAYLRAAFRYARRARLITANAVPDFPTIHVDNARQGFFERHEFELQRDAIAQLRPRGYVLADVVAFHYHSGWRGGEVLTLPWTYVDHRERMIVLPSTGSNKRKQDRVLALDYRLENGEWANTELWQLIERRWRARIVGTSLCTWVFHHKGKPIRSIQYAWNRACEATGLKGKIPHDFRRTKVRDLVNDGTPEKVAMSITGHVTREVFDRYHIVTGEDQRRALAKAAARSSVNVAPMKAARRSRAT